MLWKDLMPFSLSALTAQCERQEKKNQISPHPNPRILILYGKRDSADSGMNLETERLSCLIGVGQRHHKGMSWRWKKVMCDRSRDWGGSSLKSEEGVTSQGTQAASGS